MSTPGLRARAHAVARDASVAIDFWHPSASRDVRAYFLTHAHADHVVGLNRRNWSPEYPGARIYCSETTREAVCARWPTLGRHARALELDAPHAIRLTAETTITVTLIDAGHCPGSVMVLIDGPMGRMLHTGDFRREDFDSRARLPASVTRAPIDYLFLDNTYCHPSCAFPDRATATREVVAMCAANPGRPILLGIDSLGKEDLALAVSEATGAAVEIPDDRFLPSAYARFLKGNRSCEREFFVRRSMNESMDERERTHIRCVPKQQVRPSMLRALVKGLRYDDAPPLAILPTGWSAVRERVHGNSRATTSTHGMDVAIDQDDDAGLIASVAYSLHAPYSELEAFVRAVQPVSVFGNTRVNADAEEVHDPERWFRHLCSRSSSETDPAAVYAADAENALRIDEAARNVVVEDAILKTRVNVNEVTLASPKVPEKPSVRLVAAEHGIVFDPPRKLTWRDREAARAAEWYSRVQRVLAIMTSDERAMKIEDDGDEDARVRKKRTFVPGFMQRL